MKRSIRNLSLAVGQLDRRQVQLVMAIVTLALFVLGAGAPEAGGGSGG